MLAGIAIDKTINADLDSCAPEVVLERVDPVSIDLGHQYAHQQSVSHGILMSKRILLRLDWAERISGLFVVPEG